MTIKPTQIIILVAGVVVLLFSFLGDFVTIDGGSGLDAAREQCENFDREDLPEEAREQFDAACGDLDSADGFSAWSGDGFSPLSAWPALLALAVAGLVAAIAFANLKLPENLLGFSVPQLLVGLSAAAFLILFGFLITGNEGASWGMGFWLMFLGSIALLAGTVLQLLGIEPGKPATAGGPGPSGAPPAPF